MKRKLQRLSTQDLNQIFNEYFSTNHLSNEILDLLSNRKQRSFIIKKFLHEFSDNELKNILADY